MASIAKSQRRVTFKGDNVDALMKPPCETLEYDNNAPAAKSPGPKLTRSKRAWVPRRLRQKMAEAAAAEEKKTKPKKKVSFCPTAKNYDGMSPANLHYDQFMSRVVEKSMPVTQALAMVPEDYKEAVKSLALDFMKRYNKAWRKNPTGIKGREMKTRASPYGGFTTTEVTVYYGIPVLAIGGGNGVKVQTRPSHRQYVKTIREWGRVTLVQRAWRKFAAAKAANMEDDAVLLRRKHENAVFRRLKAEFPSPKDQQRLRVLLELASQLMKHFPMTIFKSPEWAACVEREMNGGASWKS
jgi:hypothetical protein